MHSDCNDRFSDKNISDDKLVSSINGAQNLVTDLAGFACKYLIILLLWEACFPFVRNFNKKKTKQVRCVIFSRGWRRSTNSKSDKFLPKGTRIRKSLCKSPLHGGGKGEARYIWKCRLSTSSQCCVQGQWATLKEVNSERHNLARSRVERGCVHRRLLPGRSRQSFYTFLDLKVCTPTRNLQREWFTVLGGHTLRNWGAWLT